MLPPIATCTQLQSSGPLVSCHGPPRGAAGEVRRGIDGKDQSQEDDPETESEREIAPARFQGNRRCHSAGNPRDVAPTIRIAPTSATARPTPASTAVSRLKRPSQSREQTVRIRPTPSKI